MEQHPPSIEHSTQKHPPPVLGPALAAAITSLRRALADPTAPIAIFTPSAVNGTLARRELAFATPFIRVELWTPAELESVLAEEGLRGAGMVLEPAGWLRATIARIVREDELPGGYHDVLREPGWTAALVSAVHALEGGRVSASALSSLPLAAGLRERALAMAHLLSRVEAARTAEKIAGPEEVAAAALRATGAHASAPRGQHTPANVARGAILLGDARLSRTTFEVLSRWLADRPVLRLDPAELTALVPEAHGLTRAAPHAEAVALPARAPSIALVQTPDPTREMSEAVREVQAAIERGVPLDRIAIVLPDPAEASALADALARAAIPATWQTGPALAQTPAARFLLHALDLALGEGGGAGNTVLRWYDLLRQSELRLRAVFGENGTRGRGRWRRLLSRSGAIVGTERILTALARLREEEKEGETVEQRESQRPRKNPGEPAGGGATLPHEAAKGRRVIEEVRAGGRQGGEQPPDPRGPEARETRLAALDALHAAIHVLSTELAALDAERSVGAHARLLRAFLRRWWTPSPDQMLLTRLLEGWGRSLRGPAIGLAELAATLRETLEATETLSGSLKDASVRVLSPMQLLGAELEVVLVTGMTEGRFPARPREDALLSDAILDALHRETPAGLFRSSDRVLLEKRRLAAVRSAAASTLWLSAPAVEMLEGRPLLAGSLLLEVASQLAGRRIGPSELARRMTKAGRRSRSWPSDPRTALGSLELSLARLHGEDPVASEAALVGLVDHALARRLVAAAWAEGRLARGEQDASLRAHAGFVPPAILACRGLDGDPVSADELLELRDTPERFFLRRVLGAWPAPLLRDGWDPIAAWWVDKTLLEESRLVFERLGRAGARLRDAFEARAAAELERAGVGDRDAKTRLGRMAQRSVDALMSTEPAAGPIRALESAAISPDLPWRLRGGDARVLGASLQWIVDEAPGPKSLHKARAALLETAARGGPARVHAVTFRDLRGKRVEFDVEIAPSLIALFDDVHGATTLARAGYYPPESPEPAVLRGWGVSLSTGVEAGGGEE